VVTLMHATARPRLSSKVGARLAELRAYLEDEVDGASLGLFRVGLGLTLVVAAARFFVHGWVTKYYVEPTWFFPYEGLSFVRPLPYPGMLALYAAIGILGLALAYGAYHRGVGGAAFVLFSYAHFCDKTNYLNHYYFISLVLLLVTLAPIGRGTRGFAPNRVPRLWLWLFRFQIACVYLGGGLAKLRPDWLLHAQPLGIWLSSHAGMPVLGPLFARKWVAFAMSWAGAAYDLSIPFLLLARPTRKVAYALVVVFHVLTAMLFQIGLFPYVMMFGSLLFLDPSYPRRLPWVQGLSAPEAAGPRRGKPLPTALYAFVLVYVALQVTVPLRHLAYPGNGLWTENAFRFSWHVMLMEKNGSLELTVVDPATGRRFGVEPHDYLTPQQAKQMSTQPDMILAFAHMVRDDFARRGVPGVRVYATTSEVSLNGRAPEPLVEPTVDLAEVEDGLGPYTFLRPAPTSRPLY
jgi:vitamin K-dependent gamma-carboxylase